MTLTGILIICVTISFMSCIMGCFPLLKVSKRNKLFIPDTMIDAKTLLHKERKTGLTDAEVERMMGKPKNILDIDYETDDGNTVYFEIKPTEPIQESKIRKSRVIKREGGNTFTMHEYSYIPQDVYIPKECKLPSDIEYIDSLYVQDRLHNRKLPVGIDIKRY